MIVAGLALASTLTACGVSDGTDAATTDPPSATSTTDATRSTTTSSTEPDVPDEPSRSGRPTEDELEAALPTPAEVGPGYKVTDVSGMPGGKRQDPRVAGKCDVFELEEGLRTEGGVNAKHSYGIHGLSTVGAGLAIRPPTFSKQNLDLLLEAYERCRPFTVEDPDFGTIAYDIEASPSPYGDFGMTYRSAVSYTYEGKPYAVEGRGTMFAVGNIAVGVIVRSDVRADGTIEPLDASLIDPLARLLEARAATL